MCKVRGIGSACADHEITISKPHIEEAAIAPIGRAVFVTSVYPYPLSGGGFQYTDCLLSYVCHIADSVTLVCATWRDRGPDHTAIPHDTVTLMTYPARTLGVSEMAITGSPHSTLPYGGEEARKTLERALSKKPNFVVVDHIMATWAVAHIPGDVPIVYCTHNDERLSRASIARSEGFLGGGPHWIDMLRIWWRDRIVTGRAVLVTAISRHDVESMRRTYRPRRIAYLPPVWTHGPMPLLDLASAPRAVLLLGSLLWSAKQVNMERFLTANAATFASAGVGIVVAGRAAPGFLGNLRRRFPSVTVLGEVDDERDALTRARVGILFGEAGGGFRMTGLTYTLHGLPVAARPDLVDDLGLEADTAYVPFARDESAARSIIPLIDDVNHLTAVRDRARAAVEPFADPERAARSLANHLTAALMARRSSADA